MEATHQASGYPDQGRARPHIQAAVAASPGLAAGPDLARDAAPRIDWDVLRTANRSCCCPAKPAVIALIPPAAGRPHRTDLLLCMHHFRGARQALAAAGASVLDMRAELIDPATPAYLGPE